MNTSHPDMQIGPTVPTYGRQRNILENGNVVESIAPMPATKVDTMKHYSTSAPNTSFFREDGKRIPFIHHFYETDLLYDQLYLDNEISNGNKYITYATEQEIEIAHMRVDPKGTLTKSIREELKNDPAFIAQMEEEILARLAAQGRIASDEQKLAGAGGQDGASDKERTDPIAGAMGAKVILNTPSAAVIVPVQPFRLGGIMNSNDVAKNTASSGT